MKINHLTENNRFQAAAKICLASYQKWEARIIRVKQQLLAELRDTLQMPDRLFNLALNEAEALAWQTEYPHLVFPVLAAEKVQGIVSWWKRQRTVVGSPHQAMT